MTATPSIETPVPLLGAHFSIAGGLAKALGQARSHGCDCLQIFTTNARTWKVKEPDEAAVAAFKAARKDFSIRFVASHTAYLVNLASDDDAVRAKSRQNLAAEMKRCVRLGIDAVVLHPGSCREQTVEEGIDRIVKALNEILAGLPADGPRLLLETTAGQGRVIGSTFEELAHIQAALDRPEITGVCLDTCHIFAAGYDLSTRDACSRVMADFDARIGLKHLKLLHLNDSMKGLGRRVDRHAHIGQGTIGLPAFAFIMQAPALAQIPKVIETPKGEEADEWDRVNLERLRGLAINQDPCA